MSFSILRRLAPGLFLLLLSLLLSAAAEAAGAKITDIIITQSSEDLLVFATLRDAFTKEIEEGIVNGVSTSFTYYLRLMRKRSLWVDEEVASLTVKQAVVYDPLKDRFTYTSENGGQSITRVTNSFGEIRRWMSYLERVKLASDRELTPASLYYVQVRAEIRTIKLVFPLNVLLFFVSFWDVDTPWSNSAYFALANRK
jgi:hypothetical protein